MFGKILKFARPNVVRANPAPRPVAPDEEPEDIYITEHMDTVPDTVPDTLSKGGKTAPASATSAFLDIAMAEFWQLYTLAGREVPQEVKLTTLIWRYQQLRPTHRWPYQDKSQFAKNLVACGCKSHRRTKKEGKVAMIEFPAYPAAKLPETSRSK
jgi:hypothetical protein